MPKNARVCQNCPFKNKAKIEEEFFARSKENIEKARCLPEVSVKKQTFYLIIMSCLNAIEMYSCLNCLGATGENGFPEKNKLEMYFCEQANGAKLLGEKKIFEILEEVGGSYNEYFTSQKIGHEPDIWDDFTHYVLNGGLENYYQRHPEYIKREPCV